MHRIPKANLSALFLLGALLTACTPETTALPTPAEAQVQTAEEAVYTALFAELYGEAHEYVIMSVTAPGIGGVEDMDAALENILPQMTGLDPTTGDDFRLRNDAAYPMPREMELGAPYVLLTQDEMKQIFDINTSGWDVFYTRYPGSPGLTTLSRVGFNADLTQALVYVGTMSHWLAGAGYYVLLEKISGTWQVQQQIMAWIS